MPTSPQCQTLTVRETAALLGVSTSVAHRLIRDTQKLGPLEPIRIGRRIVFGRPQVEAVLAGPPAEVGE